MATSEGSWKQIRRPFLVTLSLSFLLLQLLFLGDVSYVYGTLFGNSYRFHNFNLLYVDYDGGVVGESVMDAYHILQSNSFPTLQSFSVEDFPTPGDIRNAVCRGRFWGAVYVNPGGSAALASALATGAGTPDSISYIWNGARYPAFTQGGIYSNILQLIQVTRSTYYSHNASYVLQTADLSNSAVVRVFLDPIHATEINIKVTNQGTRVLYNTISTVMPILQQFFFMMAINGISAEFNLFTKLTWVQNMFIRAGLSISYTFIGALCMTGYIWGFKEGWDVNGNQFVLSWMVIWLYMQINFLVFDIITTFVPIQFMPFCVLTWVLINIASTLSPFELNPGFYQWGYALPSHEAYQILVQIWSDGCENQLYRALPIMFAWWIVGLVAAILCIRYRCRTALKAQSAALQAIDQQGDEDREEEKKNEREEARDPSTSELVHDQHLSRRESTVDERLPQCGRETTDAVRLEQLAYHPSYPAPWAFDRRTSEY